MTLDDDPHSDLGDPAPAAAAATPRVPDPTVMDSAMDTGSEDGEPGDRPDEGPLTPDERALLDRLTHDESAAVITDAPEDSPAAARAVAEETVLPDDTALPDGTATASRGADDDTPEFRDAP